MVWYLLLCIIGLIFVFLLWLRVDTCLLLAHSFYRLLYHLAVPLFLGLTCILVQQLVQFFKGIENMDSPSSVEASGLQDPNVLTLEV